MLEGLPKARGASQATRKGWHEAPEVGMYSQVMFVVSGDKCETWQNDRRQSRDKIRSLWWGDTAKACGPKAPVKKRIEICFSENE